MLKEIILNVNVQRKTVSGHENCWDRGEATGREEGRGRKGWGGGESSSEEGGVGGNNWWRDRSSHMESSK